jgi:transcriptional regulator with XRE-family HTH domain
MKGGLLVREARRRAGLSQAELARRTGTTQSAISRLENGDSGVSLESLRKMARACGFDIGLRLMPTDDSDWSVASGNLGVGVDERVRRHQAALRFARAGRKALIDARA